MLLILFGAALSLAFVMFHALRKRVKLKRNDTRISNALAAAEYGLNQAIQSRDEIYEQIDPLIRMTVPPDLYMEDWFVKMVGYYNTGLVHDVEEAKQRLISEATIHL